MTEEKQPAAKTVVWKTWLVASAAIFAIVLTVYLGIIQRWNMQTATARILSGLLIAAILTIAYAALSRVFAARRS